MIYKLHMEDKKTLKLLCNCRIKKKFPLHRRCNPENVVYQAHIFPTENERE